MADKIKRCRVWWCWRACHFDKVVCTWHEDESWNGPNQPCQWCGVSEGTFPDNGYNRCNKCVEPGK